MQLGWRRRTQFLRVHKPGADRLEQCNVFSIKSLFYFFYYYYYGSFDRKLSTKLHIVLSPLPVSLTTFPPAQPCFRLLMVVGELPALSPGF